MTIINVKYEEADNTHDIGFDIPSVESGFLQHFSVYVGSGAYRKHVQPYLDGGGKIPKFVEPPKPAHTPTDREILKELFTSQQIDDAKAAVMSKRSR